VLVLQCDSISISISISIAGILYSDRVGCGRYVFFVCLLQLFCHPLVYFLTPSLPQAPTLLL
jgi:hypothetical protein